MHDPAAQQFYLGRLLDRDLRECRAAIKGLERPIAIQLLLGRGLNQSQVAQVLGITPSRLSKIIHPPEAQRLTLVCLACYHPVRRTSGTEAPCPSCGSEDLRPASEIRTVTVRLHERVARALLSSDQVRDDADEAVRIGRAATLVLSSSV